MHSSNQEIALYYLLICTLVFIILGFIIWFMMHRFNQNQIKFSSDLKLLKTKHENELLQTKLLIQEQTFQNISQEIHDNVGQKLSFAKLQLNSLDCSGNNSMSETISDCINILSNSLDDLRDLSKSLNADYIMNNGLILAVENQIFQLSKSGKYHFKLTVTGESKFLKSETDLFIFRIIQEALNNIVKHADASEIKINLYYTPEYLEVTIIDNGRGFDPYQKMDGQGLLNIKQRTESLNGSFSIQSVHAEGSTITIKIPIYEESEFNQSSTL